MAKLRTYMADLGLLYSAAIWGSTFFVVKNSLASIDPVTLVAYRFLLAASLLAPVLLIAGKALFKDLKAGLILGFILWVLYVPQTIGLGITTASNSGFITGLFVAFVPVFSLVFLRKTPGAPKWIAVAISLTGLWILTGGVAGINAGDLLTIITAMACAAHLLYGDRCAKGGIDPYVLNFQQFAVAGLLSVVAAAVFGRPFTVATQGTIWVVVFLALFPTLSAFVIQLVAQKHTAAIKVSLIFTLEPAFAALFAWTVGGEAFAAHRAVGGSLIVAAIFLSETPWRNMRAARAQAD
jgi:drug/metabolite transporter (DMT)-like permease